MRVVDILVTINALLGIGTWGAVAMTKRRRRRRSPDYEHVKRLEAENEEIDRINERMRGR